MRLPVDLGRFFGIRLKIIDATETREKIKPELRIIAKERTDRNQAFWNDFNPWIDRLQIDVLNLVAKVIFELRYKILSAHL